MEIITSFFRETSLLIFLVPLVLILVVLFIVINKSKTTPIVEQIPVPPVTTTPAPAEPSEVVSQEIPNSAVSTPVVEQTPISQTEVTVDKSQVTESVPTPTINTGISWKPAEVTMPIVEEVAQEIVTPESESITETLAQVNLTQEPVVVNIEPAAIIPPQAIIAEAPEVLPVVEDVTKPLEGSVVK